MTVSRIVFGALASASAIFSIPANTQAVAAESPGQAVFERICAECHGPKGEGDKGPPIVPLLHEPAGLVSIARAGKGEMPPLPRKTISDQEIRDVAAYLKLLSGGQ